MRWIAHLLLNPIFLFWLALVIGLFFYWRGSKVIGYYLLYPAMIALFIISVTPLSLYWAEQLEGRHPILWKIPDTLSSPRILILGAGHSISPTLPPNNQLSNRALSRLAEAIRLKQQRPDASIIGSGNSSTQRTPQATVLMNAAVALGISPVDTLLSPQPYNTETEAMAYVERFGTEKPLVLVTSALHMPRAYFWFTHNGVQVIPAPTDHTVKPDTLKSPYNWKPSAHKIATFNRVIHEWAGMLYAKWKTG